MWNNFLKDYFSFSKRERKAIIIILCAVLSIILVTFVAPYIIKSDGEDHSEFEKEIAQLKIDSTRSTRIMENEIYNDHSLPERDQPEKVELFYFDPNTASENDWVRLGVREKTARTILKYVSKGGKFYKAEDIQKIWGLRAADVKRLLPYVKISRSAGQYAAIVKKDFPENKPLQSFYKSNKEVKNIDINRADTSAFISLPGIGSKLSQRIIAFRQRLGGFYSVDQVAETYFLADSIFEKIKPILTVNSNEIKKININIATAEEMKSHPYIKYNLANAIVQYRKQHGDFASVESIKKIMIVSEDVFIKVAPYLTIE